VARKIKGLSALPEVSKIKDFIDKSQGPVGRRDIARAFGIKGAQRIALKQHLRQLETDGLIVVSKRKRFSASGNLPPVMVLEVTRITCDGLAFGRPLKTDLIDPEIKISIELSSKAPSFSVGDRILVKTSKISTKFYKASVLRRLESNTTKTLGFVQKRNDVLRITPVSGRRYEEAIINTANSIEAKEGDLVEVEMQPARKIGLRQAKIVKILSHKNDQNLISLISINEFDIPTDFSPEALSLADKAKPIKMSSSREDLRQIPLITVDGEDARDFDDAIWAEDYKSTDDFKGWRFIVAIADVAHYVRAGDPLDVEAKKRGNSVYFADRVVPMLPENLSNGLCSLKPNEDRGCLAVEVIIDKRGNKKSHRFVRGVMRSKARLTYEQLEDAFKGNKDVSPSEIINMAKPLYGTYKALSNARETRGALNIETIENKIKFNNDGEISSILPRERLDSHKVIEEFMILANVCAAETLEQKKHSCVYRIHDTPNEEKISELRQNLSGFGYHLAKGQVLRPKVFNNILSKAKGKEFEQTINQLILRSQSQAEYSIANIGHFGLGLSRYAHFTSPIRRYSDLLVHRAIISANNLARGKETSIKDQQLEEVCRHISRTERRAATAERAANDRYFALFMNDKLGQTFEAIISGVKKFGVFVTIGDTQSDALLPNSALPDDYYLYDEKGQLLTGRHSGLIFRLGQKLSVTLKVADAITGRLAVEYADKSVSNKKDFQYKTPRKRFKRRSRNRKSRI